MTKTQTRNTTLTHTYNAGDLAKADQAQQLLLDFLTSDRAQHVLDHPTVTVVTDAHENIHHGDVRLDWATGNQHYLEVKAMTHDIAPRGNDNYITRTDRPWPTTYLEILKARDNDAPHTRDPQQALANIFGVTRADVAAIRINPSRRSNQPTWATIGHIPLAHTNLHPFANGATAALIDPTEKSINFHDGRTLLDTVWNIARLKGAYDAPGRVDAGGILIRHIPYGPHRLAQTRTGDWNIIGDATLRDWMTTWGRHTPHTLPA